MRKKKKQLIQCVQVVMEGIQSCKCWMKDIMEMHVSY